MNGGVMKAFLMSLGLLLSAPPGCPVWSEHAA